MKTGYITLLILNLIIGSIQVAIAQPTTTSIPPKSGDTYPNKGGPKHASPSVNIFIDTQYIKCQDKITEVLAKLKKQDEICGNDKKQLKDANNIPDILVRIRLLNTVPKNKSVDLNCSCEDSEYISCLVSSEELKNEFTEVLGEGCQAAFTDHMKKYSRDADKKSLRQDRAFLKKILKVKKCD